MFSEKLPKLGVKIGIEKIGTVVNSPKGFEFNLIEKDDVQNNGIQLERANLTNDGYMEGHPECNLKDEDSADFIRSGGHRFLFVYLKRFLGVKIIRKTGVLFIFSSTNIT